MFKNHIDPQDESLRKELGFIWQHPTVENEEIVQREHKCSGISQPDDITDRTGRRLILQNWPDSGIKRFILLWNQREAMESLYGGVNYRPALFSKGRPFDVDHIVARSRLLHIGLSNEIVQNGLGSILSSLNDFQPLRHIGSEIRDLEIIKLSPLNFRRWFPNSIGNYRYWPRRLNRKDQGETVGKKMSAVYVKCQVEDDPLKHAFYAVDEELLWQWSAIPKEDGDLWLQLPPSEWGEIQIGEFILAILKREFFLYTKAYNFLENK